MHPAQACSFQWDDANEEHLARHSITPEEVEQVWLNGAIWARNRKERPADWIMIGTTDGGRWLTIIVKLLLECEELRAITGHEVTTGERTKYLQKR